jgi:ABC-type multidrug transport system permease subunit
MYYSRRKDMISKIVDVFAPLIVAMAMLMIASIIAFVALAFICAIKLLHEEVMSSAIVGISSFV